MGGNVEISSLRHSPVQNAKIRRTGRPTQKLSPGESGPAELNFLGEQEHQLYRGAFIIGIGLITAKVLNKND